ncbi:MAG: hypothetical protein AB7G08_28715, partial [Hyphomicrobiaceae bacterium]
VCGGLSATPVAISVISDGEETPLPTPGKATGRPIVQGDIVVMQSAGGGGYGDPLSRDLDRAEEDVLKGYVSEERARLDYGVVMRPDGTVDRVESQRLRESVQKTGHSLTVVQATADSYEGVKGRHRVLRVAPQTGLELKLTAGELVEMIGASPTPLRAWIKIDSSIPAGCAPLDEFAQRALGTGTGQAVRLRGLDARIKPGDRIDAQSQPRVTVRGRRM